MKNYPKNLADLHVLAQAVEYCYEMSNSYQRRADEYRESYKDDTDSWADEQIAKTEALRDACIRLAEKLTK